MTGGGTDTFFFAVFVGDVVTDEFEIDNIGNFTKEMILANSFIRFERLAGTGAASLFQVTVSGNNLLPEVPCHSQRHTNNA